MVDDLLIADIDLAAFDQSGYGNHDRELLRIAFEVVYHRDDCFIVLTCQDDLGCFVKNLRIRFGNVKAAKRVGVATMNQQDEREGEKPSCFLHAGLLDHPS